MLWYAAGSTAAGGLSDGGGVFRLQWSEAQYQYDELYEYATDNAGAGAGLMMDLGGQLFAITLGNFAGAHAMMLQLTPKLYQSVLTLAAGSSANFDALDDDTKVSAFSTLVSDVIAAQA